jgi:hypothetical protein
MARKPVLQARPPRPATSTGSPAARRLDRDFAAATTDAAAVTGGGGYFRGGGGRGAVLGPATLAIRQRVEMRRRGGAAPAPPPQH